MSLVANRARQEVASQSLLNHKVKGLRSKFLAREIAWAVQRWLAEVGNRPLQNIHRRTLDTTWRQVVKRFGGDDVALLGPPHDTLIEMRYEAARDEYVQATAID